VKTLGHTLLRLFESVYTKLTRSINIPNSKHHLIRLKLKPYRGKEIVLSNAIIKKGDFVVELHVDNLQAENLDNSLKNIMNLFEEELQALAKSHNSQKDHAVAGIYCTTLFYGILKRKGFECFEIEKTLTNRFIAYWENMLRNNFNVNTKLTKKRFPKVCWMSCRTLYNRYGGSLS
jgi:hypothetical protein